METGNLAARWRERRAFFQVAKLSRAEMKCPYRGLWEQKHGPCLSNCNPVNPYKPILSAPLWPAVGVPRSRGEPAPLPEEQWRGSSGWQKPARGCHGWGGPRRLSPGTRCSPTWVFRKHVENQACHDGRFPHEVCLPELTGCAGSSFPSVSGSHVRSTCFSSRTITNTQSYISSAFNEGIAP